MKFESKYNNFLTKNKFENAISEMEDILSGTQCAETYTFTAKRGFYYIFILPFRHNFQQLRKIWRNIPGKAFSWCIEDMIILITGMIHWLQNTNAGYHLNRY